MNRAWSAVAAILALLVPACVGEPTVTPTPSPTQAVVLPSPTPVATEAPTATPTATATAPPTPSPTTAPTTPTSIAVYADALITAGGGRFFAEIADDDDERRQGLSGRVSMLPDQAMWFVFPNEYVATFWMFDMRFPLDIVWVDSELKVVDVTAGAPAPEPGTPPGALPTYSPGKPIQYVLEINAGLAEELAIVPGTEVTVDLLQAPLT